MFRPARSLCLTLAASLMPSLAAAQYISGDGHQYELSCNDNGFVLTSQYPVSRWTGMGADTQVITDTEVLMLGNSCDAINEVFGSGTWMWANGGFMAEFDSYRIGFPRQELSCVDGRSLPTCNGN